MIQSQLHLKFLIMLRVFSFQRKKWLLPALTVQERLIGLAYSQSTIIYLEEKESLVHVGAANSC